MNDCKREGCGHAFETHDPIDDELAGACAECDCEEFVK